VDALDLEISVPLRSFRLELAVTVEPGTTTALVGPSGAGKSTVLRAVAGLVTPECGRISLGSQCLFDSSRRVDLPPEQRRVGLVFQDYALFPHMTVLENVSYAGKSRARELLERLGIEHVAGAKPASLSGGERQRVGLARALARDPAVLLLDEPLSAVDALTRNALRAELQEVLRSLELPTLLVTHDFEDASALADRIGVIVDGRILQLGRQEDLIEAPANEFVASFTGGNLLPATAATGDGLTAATLADGSVVYSTDDVTGPVGVVVYPWEITISRTEPEGSALNHITGPVTSIVPLGNRARIRVGPVVAEITGQSAERLGLRRGERAVATFKAASTRLLPTSAATLGTAADGSVRDR
jgi:ABC-type sulfate/molybdate transport systems ATPase subunit